jgi:hypothetical protein
MPIGESYSFAYQVRDKLSREAAAADPDLRRVVGHSNLLENLIDELSSSEREEGAWLDESTEHAAGELRPGDSDSDSDSDTSSDEESDDEFDEYDDEFDEWGRDEEDEEEQDEYEAGVDFAEHPHYHPSSLAAGDAKCRPAPAISELPDTKETISEKEAESLDEEVFHPLSKHLGTLGSAATPSARVFEPGGYLVCV